MKGDKPFIETTETKPKSRDICHAKCFDCDFWVRGHREEIEPIILSHAEKHRHVDYAVGVYEEKKI